MIKSIYFPDKEFATKEALFAVLKENEENIIAFKKSIIYKAVECDKGLCSGNFIEKDGSSKGIGFDTKENYIYPIISTTKYMDSHDDVHFDGCFNKTVKEQQGKVYYCADHNLTKSGIIASKSDVEMFVKNIDWTYVGKDYEGQTQALIFAIDKANIDDPQALKLIEKERDLQNSIRMQYVKMFLAIDSTEKSYAANKAYFDNKINEISNKEKAQKQGYFFGVEALKIVGEGSLVLAGGSNDATAIYQNFTSTAKSIDKEPFKDVHKSYLDVAQFILQTFKN